MVSELLAIITSALPFVELRAGIPLAIASGIKPWDAFILCTLVNIIIIIPILLFLDFFHSHFLKFKFYRHLSHKFIERTRKKAVKLQGDMKTWSFIALSIFVAIPLPATGAWTGSLIAWLLNLNRLKSFLAIALGVLIAGFLVTSISIGLISGFNWLF